MMQALFSSILQRESLTSLFQPIVDLNGGGIIGYEGLIRGPENSPLHSPVVLFELARREGRMEELESICHRKHIEHFKALNLPGRLFLNISPQVITGTAHDAEYPQPQCIGEPSDGMVLELTECSRPASYPSLRQVANRYRGQGVQFAIDDLGEGFSSLRLWSELRPEFVKIDKYFVQGISDDPIKQRFVRSMAELAIQAGATIVAEGIETERELSLVRSLGVQCGQGYFLGRPSAEPARSLRESVQALLRCSNTPTTGWIGRVRATAGAILRQVPTVSNELQTNEVYKIFQEQSELQVVAVLREEVPIGLIHRSRMLDRLARPYQRELYGNKACEHFIENVPLVVDENTSLQNLAHLFTENNPHHLFEGFIITRNSEFIGVGTGFDLLREMTQMQMDAARYANPLTQLPGNVPINEHLDALAGSGAAFAVCYADLDYFKPFNDLYGYRTGDEAIQLTANVLRQYIDPDCDFLGHIGGDDFIAVFRSDDWLARCNAIVTAFPAATRRLYRQEHLNDGGYHALNRQGHEVFHHLLSISLGIVWVEGTRRYTSSQISEMAAVAKAQAKKISGNALFVERRTLPEPVC